jgi:nucleoid DNA-binding protein
MQEETVEYNLKEWSAETSTAAELHPEFVEKCLRIAIDVLKKRIQSGGDVHLTEFAFFRLKNRTIRKPTGDMPGLVRRVPKATFSKKWKDEINA